MTAPAYNLVFRPNDTSGAANVYSDWPTLYAARLLIQGSVQIELDGSAGVMTIPAGSYDFSGMSFISFQSQPQGYTLHFANGAVITNFDFLMINGANFRSDSNSPVCTLSSLAFLSAIGSEISCTNANASFFHIASGGTLSCTCTSEAVFGDTTQSTHEPVVKVDSGATFAAVLLTGTEFTNTVFDPASSGNIQLYMDASVVVGTQTPVTIVTNLLSVANLIAYSAASAANWNNNKPTTTAAALDRIAAKIGPIS